MATAIRNLLGVAWRGGCLAAVVLTGCDGSPGTSVDWQLDVLAPLPTDAAQVRICVTDGVFGTFGAAAGTYAITGLFVDESVEVTVNALDLDGGVLGFAGPVELTEEYNIVDFNSTGCETGSCGLCESSGKMPEEGEPSRVLGVRFLELF